MTRRNSPGPRAGTGANLRDVAREAGVSVSTASRALSGNTHISDETRARVVDAAQRLNYTINGLARSMSGAGPRPLVYLTYQVRDDAQGDIIMGLESVAKQHDSMLIVSTTVSADDRTSDLIDFFTQQRAAGVVIGRSGDDSPEFLANVRRYRDHLRSIGSPLVFCGRPEIPGEPNIPTVDYEQTGPGRRLTRALTDLGHTRIAFVGAETNMPAQLRMRGFEQGMRESGLEPNPAWMVHCRNSQAESQPVIERLLSLPDGERPTAIVAHSDYIALGAYRAARRLGLRIPDDLSVVGFGDIPSCLDVTPTLTTVAAPFLTLGRQAARFCFDPQSANGTNLHATFASTPIVRESMGPVPR
ncbi:LacI family DNA-binding transcriptional regulator [Bifidobacterium callimiconis]|nr:LacI family DNA-binding transcriptional regulator [Bifidobacterium callimiconis]MBT1175960.1 LacI family DNA-binding transcriptional regulator [Bifidobacterium callimiconis]